MDDRKNEVREFPWPETAPRKGVLQPMLLSITVLSLIAFVGLMTADKTSRHFPPTAQLHAQ